MYNLTVYDNEMYQQALDVNECDRQLRLLSNSSRALPFIDATARVPSGFLSVNFNEYGDYKACLRIDQMLNDIRLQGKYCMIHIPLDQEFSWTPSFPTKFSRFIMPGINTGTTMARNFLALVHNVTQSPDFQSINARVPVALRLGTCIPRPCSAHQVYEFINSTYSVPAFKFDEQYCRLPNDKPTSVSDYIAAFTFGILLFLSLLSTGYDLYQVFIKKQSSNRLLASFSIYSNTKSYLTFRSNKLTLKCIDGIRGLSMIWVICGHTYFTGLLPNVHNGLYVLNWTIKRRAAWLHTSPMIVDTFFVLSGIFCIYGRPVIYTAKKFVKTLPLFYAYRYLRLFPLLATAVLLQASVLHWIGDGPNWTMMAAAAQHCRTTWWSTLLHVQNYISVRQICLIHSWYVAVDSQLYLLSPLIVIFLFGSSVLAWSVMIFTLVASIVTSIVYGVMYTFPSALSNAWASHHFETYFTEFYGHTPIRAAPFIQGIMLGHLLRKYQERKIRIKKVYVVILWALSVGAIFFCSVSIHLTMQNKYRLSTFDRTINVIIRPVWGAALAWLIFACTHGYGGPVNWFLSLPVWNLPSRISYAVYLLHLELIMLKISISHEVRYFTETEAWIRCGADILLTMVVAFVLSILVDAPVNRLAKIMFGLQVADGESNDESKQVSKHKRES